MKGANKREFFKITNYQKKYNILGG